MRSVKGAFFAIYFIIFMDNFGFSVLFNILAPLVLLPQYGMDTVSFSHATQNVILAIVFGIFPLTQFIGSPLIGDFADHFGRKKAFYITILGCTLGYFLSALSCYLHSMTLLIISRFLSGFFAGNLSISLASIADLSLDEKKRAKNYAHVTTLFGVSWILAMVLGGYISNPDVTGSFGPTLDFLVTGCLSFLSLIAVMLFFEETRVTKEKFVFNLWEGIQNVLEIFHLKSLRILYLIYFGWVIGWGMSIQWLPAYSIEVYHSSVAVITTWMVILGITWTLGSSTLNHFMLKKWNSLAIATIGIICSALLLFSTLFIPWQALFGLVLSIAAIFSAFTLSNTMNLISTSASADIQGKVMGLSQSTMSLGWLVSSICAAIINSININMMYGFTSTIFLITMVLLIYLFLKRGRGESKNGA